MYLAKVRQVVKEAMRGEDVRIPRKQADIYTTTVRIICRSRERSRLVRILKVAGLSILPRLEATCIDVR